ncbi:MAG: hypothetical protein HY821_20720 [Acidobacteria bacterium]|nr:hypothetical protein [Acidobacteriota bacterium]
MLLLAAALLQTIALQAELHHVQGIVVDGDRLFVTSVDRAARKGLLSEFALPSGKLLRTVEVQQGDLFHPGGLDHDATSLWIPVAEYRPNSRASIQRRSKKTLDLISSFEVPDHVGALALSPDALILANWDARTFYRYTPAGKLISTSLNPNRTSYQDIKFRNGSIIASGLHPKPAPGGAVEFLDPATYAPTRTLEFQLTDRGTAFTHEGMDLVNHRLYFLPEDSPSRLFVFSLD